MMLWTSKGDSLLPCFFLKVSIVCSNSSTNGSAPDALPPNVAKRAPAGLTLDTSQVGMLPWLYSSSMSSLYAFAQPSLLSSTTIL